MLGKESMSSESQALLDRHVQESQTARDDKKVAGTSQGGIEVAVGTNSAKHFLRRTKRAKGAEDI